MRIRIHVTRVDTASIANAVNSSNSSGTLRGRTGEGIRDPAEGDDVSSVKRRWHEHHGDIARRSAGCGCGEDEGCDGDVERQRDVEVALAGAICVPGIGKCADHGQTVWRCREEESLGLVVIEGVHDGWEEVGYGGGGDDAEDVEHLYQEAFISVQADGWIDDLSEITYQNPSLGVGKSEFSASQERLLLAVNPVIFADIFLQSPNSQLFFFLGEPGSGPREIGQNENADKGDDNSDSTFNDEKPSPRREPKIRAAYSGAYRMTTILPSAKTLDMVHMIRNPGSNQTGESAGNQGTGVQSGGAESQFLAGIPRTQKVQTTRLDTSNQQHPWI